MFIEIDKGIFIPAEEIEYIFSQNENKSIKSMKREAKMNKTYYGKMKDYKSLVVTWNRKIYAVNTEPQVLLDKCKTCQHNFIDVSSDYHIATLYIDALVNLDSLLASGVNAVTKATDSLQLVYQSEKRKSIAMMKTKEIVYLSKDSGEVVNSVLGGIEGTSSKKAKR